MSTISSERPSPAPLSKNDDNQRFVDQRIKRTSRALKLVDLGAALITLVIGLVLYLLAAAALEHWVVPGGWGPTGRGVLFAGLVLGVAWYFWRAIWPSLRHSVSPAYAALTIEQGSPSLKNSLLSLLLFRGRRRQLSAPVYQAIEQQAAQRLSQVALDSSIDRSILLRLGSALVAVVALCALYCLVFSPPKKLVASVGRVLMPWANIAVPSRVQIDDVQPGSTSVAQGGQLTVSAEVLELASDETVRLLYSTADGQLLDQMVPMSSASGGVRFRGQLPGKRQFGSATGVQQKLSYWIEAGDARSPRYQIDVFAHPTLVIQRLRYDYPAYTGYESREVETTGDLRALEGTRVTLEALANQPIRSAHVDFQADGRHDVKMSSEEQLVTATFPLELRPDRRTPRFNSYVLKYTTTDGHTNPDPPKYRIEVIPDYAPEIQLLAPEAELLEVGLHEQVQIELEARDPDFSLSNVALRGTVDERPIEGPTLLAELHTGRFVGTARFTPDELGLQVGDLLEYWGEAVDNRQPEPNRASTEHRQLRVVQRDDQPSEGERQEQGDNQQPGAEQPDEGQQQQDDQGGEEGGEQGGEAGQAGENDQPSGDAGQESGQGEAGDAGGEGEPQATEGQQEQPQPGGESGESSQEGQNSQDENGSAAGGEGENSSANQGDSSDGQQNQPGQGQENGEPGGERSGDNSGGDAGQAEKVSSAGDDDANAFHRLAEHFDEQDANNGEAGDRQPGEQQSGEAGDNQSAGPAAGDQAEGGEQPDGSEQADGGEQADGDEQGAPGAEQDRSSQGSGAEQDDPGQPQDDSQTNDQGQQDETAPGGEMSREQGPPGAGDQPGENQGSPDPLGDKRPNDKPSADPADRPQGDDQEPAGQGEGHHESDSQSSQGGDRSGGGQEGAGQQADSEGTGAAGENQAADDGAGQADQPGAGEAGTRPGDKQPADSPTGQAGEDQPGAGSQSAEGTGDKPGGAEQGDQPNQGDQPDPSDGANQDPSAAKPGAGSQQASAENGSEPNQQDASQSSGQSPPSGGGSGGDPARPAASEPEPGDAANLEYAQKKTDLILDRLEDQLRKQEVDRSMLEKLGWSQEELRRFVARWKNLKREAAGDTAAAAAAQDELDAALRSLGLRKNRRTGFQADSPIDELRDLQEAYRGRTPQEYVEQVRAYVKGTAAARKDD